MKKTIMILIFAFFLLAPSSVSAGARVEFAWDYEDPPPADLAYFVLQQKDETVWVDVLSNIDKDARACNLTNVADGEYAWRMLAVDLGDQRSDPSNEVTEAIDAPPAKPESFRIIAEITFKIRNGEIIMSNCKTSIEPFN